MSASSSLHVPVMPAEVLRWLAPRDGQVFVDGTLGGGGHARALAESVRDARGGGLLIALDRDPAAIQRAERSLLGLPVILVHASFCDLPEVLAEVGATKVDGVLIDLGVSADQLADDGRGFSFAAAGPLDLRFDPDEGEPAWKLLERLSPEHLAALLSRYGEERYSRRIARAIVERRRRGPLREASELAQVVRRSVPRGRGGERIDPATRTFQALRIAVNDELKTLEVALRRIPDCLNQDGRAAVISFHSLEDRLVKNAWRDDPRWEVLTRRPVRPGQEEVAKNPRARSAKLRVAQRRRSEVGGR
ncbi:MAG: 16S rRNA (cytosine(1402)-N(4))-methyltransferase RsmH [Planctomycetota bacterium]